MGVHPIWPCVRDDEILHGDSRGVRDIERVFDGCRPFERDLIEIGRLRMLRRPSERQRFIQLFVEHRTPDGVPIFNFHRIAAAYLDPFATHFEIQIPIYISILIGVVFIRIDQDQVVVISVRIGEPPSDVSVTARHQHRQPRQRHADEVARHIRIGGFHDHARAIPNMRNSETQVHIVGN